MDSARPCVPSVCSYCLVGPVPEERRAAEEDRNKYRASKAKRIYLMCDRCHEFARRWPNNQHSYPRLDPMHERDVANFAVNQRHASWLVWYVNRKRKAMNGRAAHKRRLNRENPMQIRAGVRKLSVVPAVKLLSLNQVLAFCSVAGKR